VSKPIDILVIDDEQVVGDAISLVCKAEGLNVDTAMDARTGLEKLERNTYRLIVCDIMLPEMNGFHILDALKRASVLTPLIMITGFSTMQNAVYSLKNGAIHFVPKPFTAEELESAIHRGLRYGELRRDNILPKGEEDLSKMPVRCPVEYYRLGNSSWVFIAENGSGLVGVTDLFVKTIAPIREVRYCGLDSEVTQGTACVKIASKDDLVHDVLSPLSGRIIETNNALLSNPEMLEKDPYFAAWLYRIIPTEVAHGLEQLTSCLGNH